MNRYHVIFNNFAKFYIIFYFRPNEYLPVPCARLAASRAAAASSTTTHMLEALGVRIGSFCSSTVRDTNHIQINLQNVHQKQSEAAAVYQ